MIISKRTHYILSGPILLGFVLLFSIHTCQRFEPEGFLHVSTENVHRLENGQYKLSGNLEGIGEDNITEHGFCWAKSISPTIRSASSKLGKKETIGSFSSIVETGLSVNSTYYFRAYVTTAAGTEYGKEKSFLVAAQLPTVTTDSILVVTKDSAQIRGIVIDDGGATVSARGICWRTIPAPTINSSKTTNETGTGSFTSTLTGLSANTKYYVRAYATNSVGTEYGDEESFTTNSESGPTVTDIDGNVYQTVQIGEQVWMAENLKTTRYADGSAIPLVEDATEWEVLTTTDKAYCWYDNSTNNRDTYGGLYTWAAAMNGTAGNDANPSGVQGVCPDGWHLPSDAEWKELEIFLGMSQSEADFWGHERGIIGGKLKETGYAHWKSPNTGASNESGFTGLAGGNREYDGAFKNITYYGFWLSSSEASTDYYWGRYLFYYERIVDRGHSYKMEGKSVRCVEGAGSSTPLVVTTSPATSVSESSAVLNGNVTNNGGAPVSDRGFYYGTLTDPASSGSKVSEGSGTGSFSTKVSGLTTGETYYFVAYGTNSEGTTYGGEESFIPKPDITGQTGTLSDIDGNTYNWIGIGKQAWMAENLKTTRYADGSAISLVEDSTIWDTQNNVRAYCWYNNSTSYSDVYGGLYTWQAAMNSSSASIDENPSGAQGVCPEGWHLPSDTEWKELEIFLGMSQVEADDMGHRGTTEGRKLKEAGTEHWISPNTGATNESGFTALPGGKRDYYGQFEDEGYRTCFWTSSLYSSRTYYRRLRSDLSGVDREVNFGDNGFSVRCVAD